MLLFRLRQVLIVLCLSIVMLSSLYPILDPSKGAIASVLVPIFVLLFIGLSNLHISVTTKHVAKIVRNLLRCKHLIVHHGIVGGIYFSHQKIAICFVKVKLFKIEIIFYVVNQDYSGHQIGTLETTYVSTYDELARFLKSKQEVLL